MTAKGLANFSIALLTLAAVDSGQAKIAPRLDGLTADPMLAWESGRRANRPVSTRGRGREPAEYRQPRHDRRAPDFLPRPWAPADR